MQQRFLLQILLLAQHVSGTTMPISWGLCDRFSGCYSILQTGHITLSSTPDQLLENHSTKYHRQQPLYNTLELLMMGIVVSETCWASNKICNKNLCCITLAFYFHILLYILCSPILKPRILHFITQSILVFIMSFWSQQRSFPYKAFTYWSFYWKHTVPSVVRTE